MSISGPLTGCLPAFVQEPGEGGPFSVRVTHCFATCPPPPAHPTVSTFSSRSILWAGGQACWLLIAALLVQLDDLKPFV